ncbi:MAG: PTS fructose IIA subunit family protein [Chromatiales bacterium]|nr:PTS fructose IIA subunit family protein [Gammaproteobacteria bacterium]MCP5353079.1 PTS fructose IIA subunit family protein [Chromatiales bacterium]
MSVGILLVTHAGVGDAFLSNALATWPVDLPTRVAALEVPRDGDLDKIGACADALIADLNEGDGVLALVDLGGATPFNLMRARLGPRLAVVTGLNFPMLMRALNYADRPLFEVAAKAADGALRGVAVYPEVNA